MPALALAEALRNAGGRGPEQGGGGGGREIGPVLVGAGRGIEAQVLPRHPFRHYLLPFEPIYRHAWWRTARWVILAPRVWRALGALLRAERPAIVIGTGGYAAGPVVWRAQRARIPTVLVRSEEHTSELQSQSNLVCR